jgi:hypothetical protein
MPLVPPVTSAWRPDMSNMELIHSGYLIGQADGPPSFPYKRHLPQGPLVRKGLSLCRRPSQPKIAFAIGFDKILYNQ